MTPLAAQAVYIKQEAHADPRSMRRIQAMLPSITCPAPPRVIADAELNQIIAESPRPRHGRAADDVQPIVIFNQFLYHHDEAMRAERRQRFPELFGSWLMPYAGYGGWDWRRSGDAEYRRSTGLVCQPAYALHSVWGCHFRCAYCNLGHVVNIYVNLEDWLAHIERHLASPERSPRQRLFQWDNGTDVSCWEPEYGASRMLVELFARQADKYLELYVGKSDNVDDLLGYAHNGHTICCWSIGTETQCRVVEPHTAGFEARLAAARKCQQAGYTVRIRLSPMVPLVDWRQELTHLVERLFAEIKPDLITIEPLRFYTHEQLLTDFAPGVLDPAFVQAMADLPATTEDWEKSQFPDPFRIMMYRHVLDEVARVSPLTPVALCREKRRVWDALGDRFQRLGQTPDNYVCNCGPHSAGNDPRLRQAIA